MFIFVENSLLYAGGEFGTGDIDFLQHGDKTVCNLNTCLRCLSYSVITQKENYDYCGQKYVDRVGHNFLLFEVIHSLLLFAIWLSVYPCILQRRLCLVWLKEFAS